MTEAALEITQRLREACEATDDGRRWLSALPRRVRELTARWALRLDEPGGGEAATCSYVVRVRRADGMKAVLKLGLPHFEAQHEREGLQFWGGVGCVRLLAADRASGALLLERCEPGTALSQRPEPEQDEVIASLLSRLWRSPPPGSVFRPLAEMIDLWVEGALARPETWPDAAFVREQLATLRDLARPGRDDALLATDLHAGNVLCAARAPWLMIDPKPFVGDRAYDATQHLLNCLPRVARDPCGTVTSMAARCGVCSDRVRRWLLARLAVHARVSLGAFGLPGRELLQLAIRLNSSRF